ncbi:MarR family winged helix-turn-helix transcriptional regulator [Rhizobium sp. NPDC090279]|uniref:MarR family winged helix-turn-helix transcriptional regulator n=1 Tax=Rhizobium sp. NPDC090279 TaxID=3364499 RepID=UPI003839D180
MEEDREASRADEQGRYRVTEQVGHLLRKAYQRHLSIFQENATDPDLTSVQFVTLCALHDQGPISQAELVKATAVDQATIRGIIERLRARGLVTLARDATDGRKVIVSLLPAGEAVLNDMYPRAKLISQKTTSPLNVAEEVALLYLLRKIADHEAASEEAPDCI